MVSHTWRCNVPPFDSVLGRGTTDFRWDYISCMSQLTTDIFDDGLYVTFELFIQVVREFSSLLQTYVPLSTDPKTDSGVTEKKPPSAFTVQILTSTFSQWFTENLLGSVGDDPVRWIKETTSFDKTRGLFSSFR